MSAPLPAEIESACQILAARDLVLAKAHKEVGTPVWRSAEASYETLARAIAYQQISTKAAETIWGRVVDHLAADICPASVLGASDEGLRACGLSKPKARYLKTIAEAVSCGALDFERLRQSDSDAARKELTAVIGIGQWTAEIFLMNAIGKLDAFPPGDVGLMESYRLLARHDDRHPAAEFTVLAEQWRPYRGVAAHLLWGWINTARNKAYP
ncbi:MAG: DNA-3-methyladenine glycosylase 2 family protein [Pseudomonadota bacterium]